MSAVAETKNKVLDSLKTGRKTVTQLSSELALSKATVSQHLSELKNMGLIEEDDNSFFKSLKYYRLKNESANSGSNGSQLKNVLGIILVAIVAAGVMYLFLGGHSNTSAAKINPHLNQSEAATLIGAKGNYTIRNATASEFKVFQQSSGVSVGYITQYNTTYNGGVRSLNEQVFIASNSTSAYQNLLEFVSQRQLNITYLEENGYFDINTVTNAISNGGMLYSYSSYSYYSKNATGNRSVPSVGIVLLGVSGKAVVLVNISQVNVTNNINATSLANLMYNQLSLLYPSTSQIQQQSTVSVQSQPTTSVQPVISVQQTTSTEQTSALSTTAEPTTTVSMPLTSTVSQETTVNSTGGWKMSTPYPVVTSSQACSSSNGYVYCVGGSAAPSVNPTNPVIATAYYAPLTYTNLSLSGIGNIGSWSQTTAYPNPIGEQSCPSYNGYIYCVGGYGGTSISADGLQNATYFASLTPSGIGVWQKTTSYPIHVDGQSCNIYAGYIYCVGNYDNLNNLSVQGNQVYYASVSSYGIGQWQRTTNFPNYVAWNPCVTANGYIYCIGGGQIPLTYTTSNGVSTLNIPTNNTYYAQINSSGVGVWQTTSNYPVYSSNGACNVIGIRIYCIDGTIGVNLASRTFIGYYTNIGLNGSLSSWNPISNYPVATESNSCVTYSNFIYCIGGFTNQGTVNSAYSLNVNAPYSFAQPVVTTTSVSTTIATTTISSATTTVLPQANIILACNNQTLTIGTNFTCDGFTIGLNRISLSGAGCFYIYYNSSYYSTNYPCLTPGNASIAYGPGLNNYLLSIHMNSVYQGGLNAFQNPSAKISVSLSYAPSGCGLENVYYNNASFSCDNFSVYLSNPYPQLNSVLIQTYYNNYLLPGPSNPFVIAGNTTTTTYNKQTLSLYLVSTSSHFATLRMNVS